MSGSTYDYDVLVVGAGHAGTEAAAAAARAGARVALLTTNLDTVGQMSCNPAIGGVAKGQIVREIDALGGLMGRAIDKTALQFRMLNRRKGPAMHSPRAQADKKLYQQEVKKLIEQQPGISLRQELVEDILTEKVGDATKVTGVRVRGDALYRAQAVILTTGTFLSALMHTGEAKTAGGRAGEGTSSGLSEALTEAGFRLERFKTGTPPRLNSRTIDYSQAEEQPGDDNPEPFSFMTDQLTQEQLPCWISYTNDKVHQLIRDNLDRAPMYSGQINSAGPRYCPSIEDKIHRFSERERHQLFVEPEGWNTVEVYVNGFSTSLPEEVQFSALRAVPGFENVKFFRPGYAIEYDYFYPTQLKYSLETKIIDNLFFAGQINGTTGYEEAGSQGLMAGINAVLKIKEKNPFVLKRDEAYIGVLIDDLITKGTEEPYRMFTSRAEYRMLLRQDNADQRLTEVSHSLGLASDDRLAACDQKYKQSEGLISFLKSQSILPAEINPILSSKESALIKQSGKADKILSRPNIYMSDLKECDSVDSYISKNNLSEEVQDQAEIQIKYSGYIQKEKNNADKLNRLESVKIPKDFDYKKLKSISAEALEKLNKIKPETISQASRISGVSPNDISVLLVYMGR